MCTETYGVARNTPGGITVAMLVRDGVELLNEERA